VHLLFISQDKAQYEDHIQEIVLLRSWGVRCCW